MDAILQKQYTTVPGTSSGRARSRQDTKQARETLDMENARPLDKDFIKNMNAKFLSP